MHKLERKEMHLDMGPLLQTAQLPPPNHRRRGGL